MKNLNKILINENATIKDSLTLIDKNGKGTAIVINEEKRLLGTISDGDLRRAALEGHGLKDGIKELYNKGCLFVNANYDLEDVKQIFRQYGVKCIPIVDGDKKVISYVDLTDLYEEQEEQKENPVLIMAGGLGSRLRPLTDDIPKPMLHVGGRPILEIIIEQFKNKGYKNILISINYKSHVIEDYFRDGKDFGVKIKYIREEDRRGTAGAIKLAKEYLNKPFFVINGDILTNINFEQFMNYHTENKFKMTIACRNYEMQVPYGVISADHKNIKSLTEKPMLNFLVSGGIYALDNEIIDYIPENQFFDITELVQILIDKNHDIGNFPIEEYWMDIGKIEDYNKANIDIHKHF